MNLFKYGFMPEEVLFKKEGKMTNTEIASYLEKIAENLGEGASVTFTAGDRSTSIDSPTRPLVEIKVERKTTLSEGRSELSLDIELEWDENGEKDPKLMIE